MAGRFGGSAMRGALILAGFGLLVVLAAVADHMLRPPRCPYCRVVFDSDTELAHHEHIAHHTE